MYPKKKRGKEDEGYSQQREDENYGPVNNDEEAHTTAPPGGPRQLLGVQEDTDGFLGTRGEGPGHVLVLAKPSKHGVDGVLHSAVVHLVVCELLNPGVSRALELYLEHEVGFQETPLQGLFGFALGLIRLLPNLLELLRLLRG